MPTDAQYRETIAAYAAQVAALTKVAAALKDKLAAAPKAASDEAVKAAAEALAKGGWIQDAQLDQAKAALACPQTAAETLVNLAQKSAAEIKRLAGQPNRLAGGEPVGPAKAAGAELRPGDQGYADQVFHNKIMSYRKQPV